MFILNTSFMPVHSDPFGHKASVVCVSFFGCVLMKNLSYATQRAPHQAEFDETAMAGSKR